MPFSFTKLMSTSCILYTSTIFYWSFSTCPILERSSHAVRILSSFKDDIIKSDFDSVALATSLNKENILSDEALAIIKEAKGSDVETHTKLFSFVKAAVNNKHANLYVYGSVLYDVFNRKLGKDILHDYGMSLIIVVVLLITKFQKIISIVVVTFA